VVIQPTRRAELRSVECSCDPERHHVDSSYPSITKTTFHFVKYVPNLTIYGRYIPSFGNDTFLSEGLTELERISVKFSQLQTVELKAFNGIRNLKVLALSGNNISEILPGTFENLSRLQHLDLGNNSIGDLKFDAFSGLIGLISLDLSKNKLKSVDPNTFVSLPNLTFLYLDYNFGLEIPTDHNFINSRSLLSLGISNCNVSSLSEETFTNVSALKWLDLSYNNLSSIHTNISIALPNLSTLYLYGNRLHCDCQLKEVWRWCEERNITTVYQEYGPECDAPSNVKGKGWRVLEEQQCLQNNTDNYDNNTTTSTNYKSTTLQDNYKEPITGKNTEIETRTDMDNGREADENTDTNTSTDENRDT
jgi:hypothetical protein